MWISFIVYGIGLTGAVWIVQKKNLNIFIRIFTPILVFSFLSFFYLLYNPVFLGIDSWFNKTPYLEIVYFVLMLSGMSARYFTKAIEIRREEVEKKKKVGKDKVEIKSIKLEFDVYEFIYPFLFSVITFGLLLKQIDIDKLTISNIVLSFQSGFFWQTVLKK